MQCSFNFRVLLLNARTHDQAVSLKVINAKKLKMDMSSLKQEISIHKQLSHPNIIEFFDAKVEGSFIFMFIEYAPKGDLFERIASNVVISEVDAHRYFTQLMAGVEYLHQRGIAHRDLKPENLLIDRHDSIKIADFGMATIFRDENTEWLMTEFCGSLPSMAPEVFGRRYRAEPADIWSCGIILVNMLTQQRPWQEPTMMSPHFTSWVRSRNINQVPWIYISDPALQLLEQILQPYPSRRATLEQIKHSSYFLNSLPAA